MASKFFTILRGPMMFHMEGIPGTFISVARALLQANASTGLTKASKSSHVV